MVGKNTTSKIPNQVLLKKSSAGCSSSVSSCFVSSKGKKYWQTGRLVRLSTHWCIYRIFTHVHLYACIPKVNVAGAIGIGSFTLKESRLGERSHSVRSHPNKVKWPRTGRAVSKSMTIKRTFETFSACYTIVFFLTQLIFKVIQISFAKCQFPNLLTLFVQFGPPIICSRTPYSFIKQIKFT